MCDDTGFDQLLLSPEQAVSPYPVYAALRARCPMHQSAFGVRLVSRYADVERLLADRKCGRAALRAGLTDRLGQGTPLEQVFSVGVNFLDGHEHRRIRTLMADSFQRASVARLRGAIEDEVRRLLAVTWRGAEFDIVGTLARPLPVFVICSLLGIPPADRPHLAAQAAVISAAVEAAPSTGVREQGQQAMAEITAVIRDLVRTRRQRPGDDLISGLALADGQSLTDDQIVGNLVLLFGAGHETTQTLIAAAAHLLAGHPGLASRIGSDDLARRAFLDEALRLESPTQVVGRMVTSDIDGGEVVLRAGERVALLVGSAHRDEAAFGLPDRLSLDRGQRNLAFGAGPHYCLGASLALLEADVAIAAMARWPGKLREVAAITWRPTLVMRVPEEGWLTYE